MPFGSTETCAELKGFFFHCLCYSGRKLSGKVKTATRKFIKCLRAINRERENERKNARENEREARHKSTNSFKTFLVYGQFCVLSGVFRVIVDSLSFFSSCLQPLIIGFVTCTKRVVCLPQSWRNIYASKHYIPYSTLNPISK